MDGPSTTQDLCFFDFETTGLTKSCKLKCAVFLWDTEIRVFYTIAETAEYILSLPTTVYYVGWNSMAFDFRFLIDRIPNQDGLMQARLAMIALHRHYDLMLDFTTDHGYYASMDSVGTLLGATKTWNGKDASESVDLPAVVAYCCADVNVLKTIWLSAMTTGFLKRKTAGGRCRVWVLSKWATIRTPMQCMRAFNQAPPDQSWMTGSTAPNIKSMVEWATALIETAIGGPQEITHGI